MGMMSSIVGASLRLRVLIVALAALLAVAGILTAQRTAFDVFPEFAPPGMPSR
jgi:Cu/Ag efflux pump CusA